MSALALFSSLSLLGRKEPRRSVYERGNQPAYSAAFPVVKLELNCFPANIFTFSPGPQSPQSIISVGSFKMNEEAAFAGSVIVSPMSLLKVKHPKEVA